MLLTLTHGAAPGPNTPQISGSETWRAYAQCGHVFFSRETQVCTSRARFRRLLSEPHVFVCSVATILPQSSTNNLTVTGTDQIHRLAYCTVGLAGNKATLLSNVISILLSLPAVSQEAKLFNYGYESLLRNSRLGGLCNTHRIYNACMRHCDTTSTSLRRRA